MPLLASCHPLPALPRLLSSVSPAILSGGFLLTLKGRIFITSPVETGRILRASSFPEAVPGIVLWRKQCEDKLMGENCVCA